MVTGAEDSSFWVGAGATEVGVGPGLLVVPLAGGSDDGSGVCDGSVDGAELGALDVVRGAGVTGATGGNDGGVKSAGTSLGGTIGTGAVKLVERPALRQQVHPVRSTYRAGGSERQAPC
ncbi:Uncharacterised protein [Mycobacteroides abscessus]|nr:Uncharacterised protein [Mycobacteroides abscessus]